MEPLDCRDLRAIGKILRPSVVMAFGIEETMTRNPDLSSAARVSVSAAWLLSGSVTDHESRNAIRDGSLSKSDMTSCCRGRHRSCYRGDTHFPTRSEMQFDPMSRRLLFRRIYSPVASFRCRYSLLLAKKAQNRSAQRDAARTKLAQPDLHGHRPTLLLMPDSRRQASFTTSGSWPVFNAGMKVTRCSKEGTRRCLRQ